MEIIDGKTTAQIIRNEIAEEVMLMQANGLKTPHLAVIIVGSDPASQTYVRNKIKACAEVGFKSSDFCFPAEVTESELLEKIAEINHDNDINGLIIQLPLPHHIAEHKIIDAIAPEKDVDGFHPVNLGRMVQGLPTYISATPFGIVELLRRYKIETSGKNCVVIGRSNIVGTPVSILLSRKSTTGNCTVTLCHSHTRDIASFTRNADILIAAIGKPEFVTADMVKEGAVVIDVGTNQVSSPTTKSGFKLVGDVAFETVAPRCSYITPVPGGVGPMTIASLLKNTLIATKNFYTASGI